MTRPQGLGPAEADNTNGQTHDHADGSAEGEASSTRLVMTHLAVDGMSCSHCVTSVKEELGLVDGVRSVAVQLNAGGVSEVVVTSAFEPDPAAIRAAIDEAGYSLVEA